MIINNAGLSPNLPSDDERTFRVKGLKIFGGIQIGLGILCGILSLVGIILHGIGMNKTCNGNYHYFPGYDYPDYYGYTYHYTYNCHGLSSALFGFNIACFIFSGWSILTGIFPFCMNQKRRNSWRCLKITFMVCCIIGASVFMPTIFSLGVVGALMTAADFQSGGLVVAPSFLAVFSLVEMVIAIIASAYCCCCSSWGTSDQRRIVYIATGQPGTLINVPQTQIPVTYPHIPQPHIIVPAPSQHINMQGVQPLMAGGGGAPNTSGVAASGGTVEPTVNQLNEKTSTLPPPYQE